MLKDERGRGLAVEFGGNWLDFRRFEEHNAVDRERFPSFTNDLREAMFEEPIRFLDDIDPQRPLRARPALRQLHVRESGPGEALRHARSRPAPPIDWVRVDDANKYGRGGLLPMAVFLTQNAPGLRTSPVKRGYWVVQRVLGEVIPPPPPIVPELPNDEAKLDLPLREMLAKHRDNPACAGCHARFDSFGLAFEGYGPIGEARTKDLAGHPVETRADFPRRQSRATASRACRPTSASTARTISSTTSAASCSPIALSRSLHALRRADRRADAIRADRRTAIALRR